MKICQSLFEYIGNTLYKSDNDIETGVWRLYRHSLPALNFFLGLTTPVPIDPPNTGSSGIIT